MKKAILLYTIICFCFSITKVFAQPQVTAAGVTPSAGMSLTYVKNDGNYSPGSAGANQTWDLSMMGYTSTSVENFVATNTTDCFVHFPNATIASGINPSMYYTYSDSVYQFNGSCNFSTMSINSSRCIYNNPIDYMRFPMSFNTNYADSFSCGCISGGMIFHVIGEATVTVDGYGTLLTPQGVFTNVLRLHLIKESLGATPPAIPSVPYYYESFSWIKDGFFGPIATLGLNINANDTTRFGSYMSSNVGLIHKENPLKVSELYPVPANNELNVQLDLNDNQNVSLVVINNLGQQVIKMMNTSLNAGRNTIKLKLDELCNGVYNIHIINEKGIIETKRFVVNR